MSRSRLIGAGTVNDMHAPLFPARHLPLAYPQNNFTYR
jgi:hypothetical protein